MDEGKRPRVGDWQRQLDRISKLRMGFLQTKAVTHSAALISSNNLPKGGKQILVVANLP